MLYIHIYTLFLYTVYIYINTVYIYILCIYIYCIYIYIHTLNVHTHIYIYVGPDTDGAVCTRICDLGTTCPKCSRKRGNDYPQRFCGLYAGTSMRLKQVQDSTSMLPFGNRMQ